MSSTNRYGLADISGFDAPLTYDGDAELTGPQLGPPADGNYILSIRPRPDEEGQYLTIRQGKRGAYILAKVGIRYYNQETGKEGQYVGTNFLNTIVWDGQRTSDLVFLCRIAGQPAPNGLNALQLAEHIAKVLDPYIESEGCGLLFQGRTVWELSHKATGDDGQEIIQDNGKAAYYSLKGQDKVLAEIRRRAEEEAHADPDLSGAAASAYIKERVSTASYYDPITGDDRQVRTTLVRIIGPVV